MKDSFHCQKNSLQNILLYSLERFLYQKNIYKAWKCRKLPREDFFIHSWMCNKLRSFENLMPLGPSFFMGISDIHLGSGFWNLQVFYKCKCAKERLMNNKELWNCNYFSLNFTWFISNNILSTVIIQVETKIPYFHTIIVLNLTRNEEKRKNLLSFWFICCMFMQCAKWKNKFSTFLRIFYSKLKRILIWFWFHSIPPTCLVRRHLKINLRTFLFHFTRQDNCVRRNKIN